MARTIFNGRSIASSLSAALLAAALGLGAIAVAGGAQAQSLGDILSKVGETASELERSAQAAGDRVNGGEVRLAKGEARPYRTESPGRSAPVAPDPRAHHLDWDTKFTSTGLANRKLIGHDFLFYCPPAPTRLTPRKLFGTDRYAFHSVVCRAAVHAGKIDFGGGNVTVRMLEGNMKLTGSLRNGVESSNGSSGIRTLVFVN